MKKETIQKSVGILIFLILGGIVGYQLGQMTRQAEEASVAAPALDFIGKMSFVSGCVVAVFLVLAWHEIGHAIAGIGVGFDFRMLVVGPVLWEKDHDGWHFRKNKNISLAGGMVLCLPTNTRQLSQKFVLFAAGGPLASLLLAVVAGGIGFYGLPDTGTRLDKMLFIFTAIVSSVIFLVTIIPTRIGSFYSDGARILRLLSGGDIAKFDIFTLKMIANSMSGVRPKLMDVREITEAKAIADRLKQPFGVYLNGYLHQVAFDRGDWEAAEKHLLDYVAEIAEIPVAMQPMVWLDAAFFYAYAKKDLAQAEQYWHHFKAYPMLPKAHIFATEAALAVLKNDAATAAAKKAAALQELPNMLDQGIAVVLRERLVDL